MLWSRRVSTGHCLAAYYSTGEGTVASCWELPARLRPRCAVLCCAATTCALILPRTCRRRGAGVDAGAA